MAVGRPITGAHVMSLGTSNVGVLMPSTAFRIYLEGTSTLATAYSDAAGSVVLASPSSGWPLATDALGNLPAALFLAPGSYELEINGARQPVSAVGPLPGFYVGPPAAGTASGKDKAAVLAAINAAKAGVRGGRVVWDRGDYDVGDLAILWPEFNITGKQLGLQGQGDKATVVKFSVDRGLGTYAIAGDYAGGALTSLAGGLYHNDIIDMRIIGPGTRGANGTSPCNMNGVMLDSRVRLIRADISLFRTGINNAGNHQTITDCTIGNNYDGCYHSVTPGLGGDTVFTNTSLAGNLRSSHAVAPTAAATFNMIRGHTGFGPYDLYAEGGRAAGSAAFYYSNFYGTSFEKTGNGFLYSEDQNAMVTQCSWFDCANFSIDNAVYGLPSSSYDYHVRLHTFSFCKFDNSAIESTPGVAWMDVSTSVTNIQFSPGGKKMVTNALAAGKPLVRGPAIGSRQSVTFADQDFRAKAAPVGATYAVAAKKLVEWYRVGYVREHGAGGASAKLPLAGVALTAAATSSRDYVIVAAESTDAEVTLDGGAPPNIEQVVTTSATNPSHVSPLSWDGTTAGAPRPIVGILYLAVPGNATVRLRINLP